MSYSKYFKYKKQVSYDDGLTWEDVIPYVEIPTGSPIGTYETLSECDSASTYLYAESDESGNTYLEYCGDNCAKKLDSDSIQLMSSSSNYVSLKVGGCCYYLDLYNSRNYIHYFKDVEIADGLLYMGSLMAVFDERDVESSSASTIHIPDSVLIKSGASADYPTSPDYKHPNVVFGYNSSVEVFGDGALACHGGIVNFTTPSGVWYVGEHAFHGCGHLEKLSVGSDFVGDGLVSYCSNLTGITFTSNSLKSIGGYNYQLNSLRQVVIPSSVVYVSGYFLNTGTYEAAYMYFGDLLCQTKSVSITGLNIDNGTKYVSFGDGASTSIKASATTIPSSVISITGRAFRSMSDFNSLIGGGSSLYYADNGKTYVRKVVTSTKTAYGHGDFESTTRFIGSESFANAGRYLTSVDIPEGVVQIGERAFAGCSSLASVTLPSTLLSIDHYAFSGCTSLASITIPNSVKYIGTGMFRGCRGLTNITLSNNISSIPSTCFSGCTSLTGLTIPSSVKVIGDGSFKGCTSLTGLTIPSSVRMIGSDVFSGCTSMTSLVLNDGIQDIGSLYNTSLTSLSIPASVRQIGYIPDSVTSLTFDNNCKIKELPYYCAKNITSLTLPPSIALIHRWQIINWGNMQNLYITSPCVVNLDLALEQYHANYVNYNIHVQSYLVDKYKNDPQWSAIASRIVSI